MSNILLAFLTTLVIVVESQSTNVSVTAGDQTIQSTNFSSTAIATSTPQTSSFGAISSTPVTRQSPDQMSSAKTLPTGDPTYATSTPQTSSFGAISSTPVTRQSPDQRSFAKTLPTGDPTYARTVAAIAGGCGIFVVNTVFFIIVSFLLRYNTLMERHKMPKVGRKSLSGPGGIFYNSAEVQSAQALFAPSLSATNIVSNASDIQLDASGGGRGVYHNRAFDAEASHIDQAGGVSLYKPIVIKSSQGAQTHA